MQIDNKKTISQELLNKYWKNRLYKNGCRRSGKKYKVTSLITR